MIEFFPKPIFFWKNIINYKILLTYCKYPRQIVINTKYSDCKYSAIIISEGIIELQISVIMIRECRFLNFNVSQSCWAFCHWKISQISGPFPLKYPCFCPKSPWGGVILALFYPKIAIFGFQLLAINPGFLSLKNISTVMWFLFHHKHPWCVKFEEKAIFSVTNQLVFFGFTKFHSLYIEQLDFANIMRGRLIFLKIKWIITCEASGQIIRSCKWMMLKLVSGYNLFQKHESLFHRRVGSESAVAPVSEYLARFDRWVQQIGHFNDFCWKTRNSTQLILLVDARQFNLVNLLPVWICLTPTLMLFGWVVFLQVRHSIWFLNDYMIAVNNFLHYLRSDDIT